MKDNLSFHLPIGHWNLFIFILALPSSRFKAQGLRSVLTRLPSMILGLLYGSLCDISFTPADQLSGRYWLNTSEDLTRI